MSDPYATVAWLKNYVYISHCGYTLLDYPGALYSYIRIKTHGTESRGQEAASRHTVSIYTRSTALKFVNVVTKPH